MSWDLGSLNWGAVIVAALAMFVFGAVWYAPPVLGKTWASAGGMEVQEGQRPSPVVYLVPLVGSLFSAIVLGLLVQATGADGAGDGLSLGLAVAIGFAFVRRTSRTRSLVSGPGLRSTPATTWWGT